MDNVNDKQVRSNDLLSPRQIEKLNLLMELDIDKHEQWVRSAQADEKRCATQTACMQKTMIYQRIVGAAVVIQTGAMLAIVALLVGR